MYILNCILLFLVQVWDVISNKEAVDIVASAPGRGTAARALIDCATRAWRLKYPTSKNDDCAVVCLYLEHACATDVAKAQKNVTNIPKVEVSTTVNDKTANTGSISPSHSIMLEHSGTVRRSEEIVPVAESAEVKKNPEKSMGQSKRSLADCISTAEDEEWSALEGITRVNSLLSLPRFLSVDKGSIHLTGLKIFFFFKVGGSLINFAFILTENSKLAVNFLVQFQCKIHVMVCCCKFIDLSGLKSNGVSLIIKLTAYNLLYQFVIFVALLVYPLNLYYWNHVRLPNYVSHVSMKYLSVSIVFHICWEHSLNTSYLSFVILLSFWTKECEAVLTTTCHILTFLCRYVIFHLVLVWLYVDIYFHCKLQYLGI